MCANAPAQLTPPPCCERFCKPLARLTRGKPKTTHFVCTCSKLSVRYAQPSEGFVTQTRRRPSRKRVSSESVNWFFGCGKRQPWFIICSSLAGVVLIERSKAKWCWVFLDIFTRALRTQIKVQNIKKTNLFEFIVNSIWYDTQQNVYKFLLVGN